MRRIRILINVCKKQRLRFISYIPIPIKWLIYTYISSELYLVNLLLAFTLLSFIYYAYQKAYS